MAIDVRVGVRGKFGVRRSGEAKTPKNIQYSVMIQGSDKHLNPNGRILDNTNVIQDYFRQTYNGKTDNELESAEQMSAEAVRYIRGLFGGGTGNADKVYAIEVIIDTGQDSANARWRESGNSHVLYR